MSSALPGGSPDGIANVIIALITSVFITLVTLITTCISIASFVIGHNNWNVTCDDSSFMPLPIWLVTIGTISFVYCVISVIFVIIYFIKLPNSSIIKFLEIFVVVAGLLTTPFAITGTIIMTKYAGSCYDQAYLLWAISMTTLVLDWLIIILTVAICIAFILYQTCRNKPQHS